jgi:hypothetical protein
MDFIQRLRARDPSLFKWVESQTGIEDQRSLLAIQDAVASRGPYRYLEIGSFKGGTLQPHIVDPRCRSVLSIDPRPGVSADERFEGGYDYGGVSTAAMLWNLRSVPGGNADKIETLEASVEEIVGGDYPADVCFIDGEHTNAAALRDARFCLRAIQGNGIIAFHDRAVVAVGIQRFLSEACGYRAYALRTSVFVVEFGGARIIDDIRGHLARPAPVWVAASRVGGSLTLLRGAEWYHRASLRFRRLLTS